MAILTSMLELAEQAVVLADPPGNDGAGRGPGPSGRFTPIPAHKIRDQPPIAWLVKGEIPKLGLTVIYGATGIGKSFVALDYAFEIARTHPVIYVAAEGAAGCGPRVLAWEKHHQGQELGRLYFVDRAVSLLNPNEVEEFIAAISGLGPYLVIFDTLARCLLGGDENSAQSMGQAVDAADRIKRSIGDPAAGGGAVILVHHATKAGNTERGSGALKGGADQVIRLDGDDGLLTLSCEKSKDAAAFADRYLRLLPVPTGRLTEDGEMEVSCVTINADKVIMRGSVTPSGRKILEKLALEVFSTTGARSTALQDATGLSRSTFYNAVSLLLGGGFIEQDAKGEPFRITEAGKEALQ